MSVVQIVAAILGSIFGIWLYRVAHDFHQMVRKAITALDRDQQVLDSLDDDHITLDELNIIAVDTTDMAKQDAVLAFIDAWEKHHEQSHD